jgi:hypothetical protein
VPPRATTVHHATTVRATTVHHATTARAVTAPSAAGALALTVVVTVASTAATGARGRASPARRVLARPGLVAAALAVPACLVLRGRRATVVPVRVVPVLVARARAR